MTVEGTICEALTTTLTEITDMARKIHLNEAQLRHLAEMDYNYHFGKDHNGKPHYSDNKYQMVGRDTGHFGSGTYFSTYKYDGGNNVDDKYGLDFGINPRFIQVANNIYRVDLDFYKNLYKVHSKREGDVLYTLLANLNHFYNRITVLGEFRPKEARYSNANLYQEIAANAKALNLKCPSYYELTRLAQRHNGVQSFSTLFMEMNGFNGVNVSGIEFYDNTKHGSVIYDLSKTDSEVEQVSPDIPYMVDRGSPYNDTVVYDEFNDYEMSAARGKDFGWTRKLNTMPANKALRILKNYASSGNILDSYNIDALNDGLKGRYLRILFSYDPRDTWNEKANDDLVSNSNFYSLVKDCNAWYWCNYLDEKKKVSGLLSILHGFDCDLDWDLSEDETLAEKKRFLDSLMSNMRRGLTDYEQKGVDSYLSAD